MHLPHWHESDSHKHKKNYVIGKKIGEGGYAQVFQAHDVANGKEVAIKVAPKKFVKSPTAQVWIMTAMTERLRHPHVIRMLEWWEGHHAYYMVYELAVGELFDRLVTGGPLSEAEVRQVILALLDALVYIHSQNIIHRDLKPENVLFKEQWSYKPSDEDGLAPIVITDFGLAVELHSADDKRWDACGSPVYAAPEVYEGKTGYNASADVWSIGIIAYALMSGHYPFESTQLPEVLNEALKGEIRFPGEGWTAISQDAKDFILCLLKVDPSARPTARQALEHCWLKKPVAELQERPQPPPQPNANVSPCMRQATLISIQTDKAVA